MKANVAIGILETSSIAKGVECADVMCKAAGVELSKAGPLPRGKFIVIVSGPVGEVESSLRAGAEAAADFKIAHFIIRNVHEQVVAALEKRVPSETLESVGIIETGEASPVVFAADAAAKAARVHLLEIRIGSGIGGKGYLAMTGEVGAVRTAVSAGVKHVPEGMLVSRVVIPMAHEHLRAALM